MSNKTPLLVTALLLCTLIVSVYLAHTDTWIAKDINLWQATILPRNSYYPMITAACLFIPPAMIFLFLSLIISGRFSKKTERQINE
jgi:hypothetical protein